MTGENGELIGGKEFHKRFIAKTLEEAIVAINDYLPESCCFFEYGE